MKIDSSNIENKLIPEKISKKLRASYYFMGALLGKLSMFKCTFLEDAQLVKDQLIFI